MNEKEKWREIVMCEVYECVGMWVCLKVFLHLSSAVSLLNSLFVLLSLSDPLEMKTSAEWNASHKGTNTHPNKPRLCFFVYVCVSLFLVYVRAHASSRGVSQQSRAGNGPFSVLQISPRTIKTDSVCQKGSCESERASNNEKRKRCGKREKR